MSRPSDPELVKRCLAHERGAWEALVGRYGDLVYGIARRCGLDGPRAEDVVQDVFMVVLKNLGRLRSHDHLMGWIVRTARRAAWRVSARDAKKRARDDEARKPDTDPGPDAAALTRIEERRHLVREAVARLDPRCRSLLQTLFLREGDYEQLVEEQGIPMGSIGPTRGRCLKKLARELEGLGLGPADVSPTAPPGSGGLDPETPQPDQEGAR